MPKCPSSKCSVSDSASSSVLRCGVDPLEGRADATLHRADVDQDAAPSRPPPWDDRLGHAEGAERVDIEHPDDVLEREVLQGTATCDPGVVDHGVELSGCVDRGLHRLRTPHVEAENLFDLQVLQYRDIAGGGHHVMTALGQHLCGRPTDGTTGTGDQDAHAPSMPR